MSDPPDLSQLRIPREQAPSSAPSSLAGFPRPRLLLLGLVAAVLGSMNTMIAVVAARTHEIGVLLSVGFRCRSIFATFLFESALMGLVGGLLGILFILPFQGMETGAVNWNTFTDVSFSFQITLPLALRSFGLAFVLGLIGGVLPAIRAARLRPVEALREV